MNSNKFLKFLCSYPIIFLTLYFIPFLGICLLLARYLFYDSSNKLMISLIILGLIIFIPAFINLLLNYYPIDSIFSSYITIIISSNVYYSLLSFGKLIICIGIVSLIIKKLLDKLSVILRSSLQKYINKRQEKHNQIIKNNDLKIKIMKEKAKNTSYVKCPNCGADNLLSSKFGICKYCRSKLENKKYK